MHRKLSEKPNMSTTFPGLVHDAEVLLLFFFFFFLSARVCGGGGGGGGGRFPCL